MSKEFSNALLWLLAAGSIFFLPCCLVLLLELYPGTTYSNHLATAMHLLAASLFLVLTPRPPHAVNPTVPEEHRDQLKYSLRSGILPLASLFSDWRDELAGLGRTHDLAVRVLPAGMVVVILFNVYGIFIDPAGRLFFLSCAVASAAFGVAAFSFSAVRLKNILVVEDKLRRQISPLQAPP